MYEYIFMYICAYVYIYIHMYINIYIPLGQKRLEMVPEPKGVCFKL